MVGRLLSALAILTATAACDGPAPKAPPLTDPRHLKTLRALGIHDADGGGNGSPGFQCSDTDSLLNSTAFRGTGADGEKIEGVICCGWMKGCTVRF